MKDYKFSMDFWNDDHYKNFEKIVSHFRYTPHPKFLEIGTFEGRTAFWLLDNIQKSKVTVIDPEVGPNFRDNFVKWTVGNEATRFNWRCDYSFPSLLEEYSLGNKYDLIYIDGDHNSSGVLEDAIIAWKLLKIGGILLFDDYMMEIKDPWFYISHKEFLTHKNFGLTFHHPKEAVDAFLNIYKGQYEMYIDNYQIGIVKFVQIGEANLNHGDNTQRAIYEKHERVTG
jgi:hypothetical protein